MGEFSPYSTMSCPCANFQILAAIDSEGREYVLAYRSYSSRSDTVALVLGRVWFMASVRTLSSFPAAFPDVWHLRSMQLASLVLA